MVTADEKLNLLSARITVLVVALIILAVILISYMAVECTVLFYSMCKKRSVCENKTCGHIPDGVVVKGGKPKSKKKSKSKSGKKSKKASKDSSAKTSQSSAMSSAATVEPSKQQKGVPTVDCCGVKPRTPGNVKTARDLQSFTSNATKTEDQIKAISSQFDNDERTVEQIRKIPPQFENDERTVDQIRNIPPQFDNDVSPDNTRCAVLSENALQQIAATVVAQLERSSKLVTAKGSDFKMPDISVSSPPKQQSQPDATLVAPPIVQQPVQQPVQQTFDRSAPNQGSAFAQPVQHTASISRPAPFAQSVQPAGLQAESVYFMEGGGPNGEIQKADMPVQPNANNSLMIDGGNVVPVATNQGTQGTMQ